MNKGKICVSVSANTRKEFLSKIGQVAQISDVIELRFDLLSENEFSYSLPDEADKFRAKIFSDFPDVSFIETFRPRKESGADGRALEERMLFWSSSRFKTGADIESEIYHQIESSNYYPKICSIHDFENAVNIDAAFSSLLSTDADIIKIAVQIDEITESLDVWKLFEKAKVENRLVIPIAMGEAGKWMRILGLSRGAPMTYASLESGEETAPGQISIDDLTEVYRVQELDEKTEIYGIIGNPVSHSLSPYMHNAAFKYHNLNAVYIPFEVADLAAFIGKMVKAETRKIDWNLKGFSVTSPHKEAIIDHLDHIDDAAKQIGAVNTVKVIDGMLHGYNTDADGFIEPLKNAFGDLRNAAVGFIGSGGASRACIYALRKEGVDISLFARNVEAAKRLEKEFRVPRMEFKSRDTNFGSLDILVNCTPLGTIGEFEDRTAATSEQLGKIKLACDLVYNPVETRFLGEARKAGAKTLSGLEMLVAQAAMQFEIWTGERAPTSVMREAAFRKL